MDHEYYLISRNLQLKCGLYSKIMKGFPFKAPPPTPLIPAPAWLIPDWFNCLRLGEDVKNFELSRQLYSKIASVFDG